MPSLSIALVLVRRPWIAALKILTLPPATSDPAQHGSLPAGTACHSLWGLASPDYAPFLAPLFREGPFDAASCPEATTHHPLIGTQQDGCTYQFTSYHDYEHSHVKLFAIQLHHPQFLEWVGAPESARPGPRRGAPGDHFTNIRISFVKVILKFRPILNL